MNVWTLQSGYWRSGPGQDLTGVTAGGWKLSVKVDDVSSLSFDIPTTHPKTLNIQERQTDLWLWCSGWPNPVHRGRVTQSGDALDDSGKVSFASTDYRGVFDRRTCWDDWTLTRTNYDPAVDAWQLIQAAQAEPGGNLGIVRGATPSGAPVSIASLTHQAGNSVKAEIDANAKLDPGFDWDITPVGAQGLQFDVWRAGRGQLRPVYLKWDPAGSNGTGQRQSDSTGFGNAVRLPGGTAGSTQLPAVRKEAPDIATRPEGRWDLPVQDNATFTTTAAGQARAATELNNALNVGPSWTFALADGVWNGPQDFWVGDTINLQVKYGRLAVDEQLRVMQLDVTGSPDRENATVAVTLGAYTPKQVARLKLRGLTRQIGALQRR